MDKLPVELVEKIMSYATLDIQDVINVSLISTYFQNLIRNSNAVWRNKFIQRFPTLQNKLQEKPLSYYQELRHLYLLRKKTRILLDETAQKYYRKLELSEEDLKNWEHLVLEKWDNYFYLVLDLMDIVHTKCTISTNNIIPLNTPGNLTQKYYAAKVLRFIRQIHLTRIWKMFISKPLCHRLLEDGAIILAQWCQPNLEIEPEAIHQQLDQFADMVKGELERVCPSHPLFKVTEQQLQSWKFEVRPDNEWSPKDCRIIINSMNEVLFHQLGFTGFGAREPPYNRVEESDFYINIVLKIRRGCLELLAVIYDAVARRLGLRCEPLVFPSHFLLRFCENQHPDSDMYYIDMTNRGDIVKKGICPFSRNLAGAPKRKRPTCLPEDMIAKIATDLDHLSRRTYSPSDRDTNLRSTLELIRLVNPKDIRALIDLSSLYMQHNFDTTALRSILLSYQFTDPEVQGLSEVLRDYHPEPCNESVEPVKRPPDGSIKFAVGMVMSHKLFGYKCVIFNWDPKCMAGGEWKWRNNIAGLMYKDNQPFYNVLAEDNSHRYVAQENLLPICEPQGLQLDDEVGRYFSHYYETHYVPNTQTENHFPEDGAVRSFYHSFVQGISS